jgi:CHAT domain-containing protein
VLVPSGPLFNVPWSLLPGLDERPLTVAPSAAVLATVAAEHPPDLGPPVFAAGPSLAHVEQEVVECGRRHHERIVLTGEHATPGRLLADMDGASLAHLACHGRFRPEHPWFSSLSLAGGELTVHELQLLGRTPRILILAACDVGTNAPSAGEEAIGFLAALLASGTSALIASPLPVSDEATSRFMVALHDVLAQGIDPATALLVARRQTDGDGPLARLTARSFAAYGALTDGLITKGTYHAPLAKHQKG